MSDHIRFFKQLSGFQFPFYKEEGITFNEKWKLNDSIEDFQECLGKDNILGNSLSINAEKQKCSGDGEWSEDEAEIVAGVTDTMLTARILLKTMNVNMNIFSILHLGKAADLKVYLKTNFVRN